MKKLLYSLSLLLWFLFLGLGAGGVCLLLYGMYGQAPAAKADDVKAQKADDTKTQKPSGMGDAIQSVGQMAKGIVAYFVVALATGFGAFATGKMADCLGALEHAPVRKGY